MTETRPEGSGAIEVAGLRRVVAVGERFAADWAGSGPGSRPRIEDYLPGAEIAASERDRTLVELIGIEVELRTREGARPKFEDYLARFPDQASSVAAAFIPPEEGTATGDPARPDETPTEPRVPGPGDDGGPMPERLGRYRLGHLIGRGAFARVFLARDEELGRAVAIKVPYAGLLGTPDQVDAFLAEARHAASLAHPGIVRVLDMGREGDLLYLVLDYVDGPTLAKLFREARPSPTRLAAMMIVVAEAAHHAHKANLVHRDLKPSNILIDARGEPRVADFGLAVREDLQHLRAGEIAGTPAYMAPEQVRGETHRLDGRTDIWALGVILYQGLVGRPPFSGRDRGQIFDEVLHRDPRPPRQVDDTVPRELERICLKCLSRRMTDRYQTAADLAEDLRAWISSEAPTAILGAGSVREPGGLDPRRPRVIPKGLRAFGVEDADFFPSLLPGPRDRDGLPESIRSWKARIEGWETSTTFTVGLLYGPSGCGKSSLVRAGLLPRLAGHVRPVYVEATPDGTEARLLAAVRREFPGLPGDLDLVGTFDALRAGRGLPAGTKVLIVLDQFEQWLHRRPDIGDDELVQALRHCDGSGLQTLLLVRDEFWMAITRFLRAIEVRLVEGENSAAVELFDQNHARRVLAEFGRAQHRIPEQPEPRRAETERFLDYAIAELAGADGRIIPVRLNLFAEMVRHREWTPATLRDLGGIEGIGVTFLEETFCAPTAPPLHRVHWRAAQAVFAALLPEPSSDLKGRLRSDRDLREVAGYGGRPDDFADLMRVIDNTLRMVTPADPEGLDGRPGPPESDPGATYYGLTHDYLVPPLRQWLNRKRGETPQGRAELRLAAVTAHWRDRPEPRRLPSTMEWIGILYRTRSVTWSPEERRMMQAASRHHLRRAGMVVAMLALAGLLGLAVRERARTHTALAQALKADFGQFPDLLPDLVGHLDALRGRLETIEGAEGEPPREREVAGLLLFQRWPTPARAESLRDHLRDAGPDEAVAIAGALAAHPDVAGLDTLSRELADESTGPAARLRFAHALTRLGGLPPSFPARSLVQALLAEDRRAVPQWMALLRPVVPSMVGPLAEACRDPAHDPVTRSTAAEALADALADFPASLAREVVAARPDASRILLRALATQPRYGPAIDVLRDVLRETVDNPRDEAGKDATAARHAAAAIALASLGEPGALWPLLDHRPDPRLRSLLIQRMGVSDLPPRLLLERLRHPEIPPTERQALLLAWAEMPRSAVLGPVRSEVVAASKALFADDPDPGVHSAAELLLRRWDPDEPSALEVRTSPAGARWRVGPNDHIFVAVPGPLEYWIGSPNHEAGREPNEARKYRRIARSIEVATKEVTLTQYRKSGLPIEHSNRFGPTPDCPVNCVTWMNAARYCNWLSAREGLDPSEWAYPVEIKTGMTLDARSVERTGYRLPTEAEWEYLCRAGTTTAYSFGQSEDLLTRHGWTFWSLHDLTSPVGTLLPNELGLFDMHGNVWEWCHDGHLVPGDAEVVEHPPGTPEHPGTDAIVDHVIQDGSDGLPATRRVARGGAYSYSPSHARSANHYIITVPNNHPYMGIRVVRTSPRPGH